MRCPKCGFEGNSKESCEACGVIYSRLRAREQEPQSHQEQLQYASPPLYEPMSTRNGIPRTQLITMIAASVFMAIFVLVVLRGKPQPGKIEGALAELLEPERVKKADAIMVEFWATWCGPCKAFAPTVESVEEHFGEKLYVVGLDYDQSRELVQEFHVRCVPTVLLFRKNGQLDKRIEGGIPEDDLRETIETVMSKQ